MKKSRKKMLLSSIAMLLVALIALGSATFAWYITQTSVTANEMSVSAAKAEGLEIRKYTGAKLANDGSWGDWTTSIELDDGAELSPSSINYTQDIGDLIYATGGVGTNYNSGTLVKGLGKVTTGYSTFVINRFQVASSGTETPTVDWAITDVVVPTGTTYMAFAVYKDDQLVGSWTTGTAASKKVKITSGSGASASISATEGEAYSHKAKLANATDVPQSSFTVGTKSSPTDFTVIGFADGFDDACKSANANNKDVKISFTFTKHVSNGD